MKKYYLLTPGPTPIPPETAVQASLPILHHRTHEFGAVFVEVLEGLKYTFQTQQEVLLLTSSGTGGMESAVVNLLSPGDHAIVASSGVFGERWGKLLEAYGIQSSLVRAEWGRAVDPEQLAHAVKQHPEAKAVFTTHTETSTGVVNDIQAFGDIVHRSKAVLVVDAISGLGGEELHTDAWHVDVAVAGSQKGLMAPPGLAFVAISPKAWQLVESARSPRCYWDYRLMKQSLSEKETPFTPAVSLIMGLAESLRLIRKDGLETIWQRHIRLAEATRAGLKALGLPLFADPPCHVLTAVRLPAGMDGKRLIRSLRDTYGVSIAGGQESLAGKIIRLAHMGYMDRFDVLVGLGALEMAFSELGYPVTPGCGVAAAERVLLSPPTHSKERTPARQSYGPRPK
ncbi:MAG: alanine--glyoxylate aminotransferase family protein [Elusimicrobia bacterium]|nr:alanine--glyoxylate aminotransferase family protein [Elusimicrobiota bacterium]